MITKDNVMKIETLENIEKSNRDKAEENVKKDNRNCSHEVRYENIDLLKCIAIFMVILIHIPAFNTYFIEEKNNNIIIQYSLRLISEGVLIFIFVNGFLLLNKPFDYKKHIKKIFKMFCLIIFWGIVYVITKSIIRGEEISLFKIINIVLSIELNNTYVGNLWFLQSLICLYIFFPILKYIHDSNRSLYKYLCLIIIIFSVGINLFDLFLQMLGNILKIQNLSTLVLNNFNNINLFSKNLGMFGFYFILGGYVFENKHIFDEKKNVILAIVSGAVAWIMATTIGIIMSFACESTYPNNYNYYQIFMAITIVGIYALSTMYTNSRNNIYNRIVTSIGKNTMGIYLVHQIIIELVEKHISIIKTRLFQRVYIAIIVLIVSWIISLIFTKIKKINTMFKI